MDPLDDPFNDIFKFEIVLNQYSDIYSKRDSDTLNTPLSTTDYAIMIFYFAVVIFLGFVASKKQSHEGFLIADRNLRTFANHQPVNVTLVLNSIALTMGGFILGYFLAVVFKREKAV